MLRQRLHHTVEQFVMVPQMLDEIWKVIQAALVQSHCTYTTWLQVSTDSVPQMRCAGQHQYLDHEVTVSKFPSHWHHCEHSEVVAEVCARLLTTTSSMILPMSWKVCRVRRFVLDVCVSVIFRREDLGKCFELYGILASDELSEERFRVTTTFFESLDAEVEWINVADICEHRVYST